MSVTPYLVGGLIKGLEASQGGLLRSHAADDLAALKKELRADVPPATYGNVQQRLLDMIDNVPDGGARADLHGKLTALEASFTPPLAADLPIVKPKVVRRPAGCARRSTSSTRSPLRSAGRRPHPSPTRCRAYCTHC